MPGFIIPIDIGEDFNRGENGGSDFREVPASDKGNASYADKGRKGSYSPKEFGPFTQYPEGVKFESGYGASEADMRQGFIKPGITEDPAYQLSNYKDRWDQPRRHDVSPGNVDARESDFSFRERNRETRGFLPRPRIPRERG